MRIKEQKMRVRNHQVVLNRSVGGDTGIFVFLAIMGVFMFLPMYYTVIQSFKPLDELWMFPPRFYVSKPTGKNFSDLFSLLNTSWVPFSRYIFNTVFITAAGTFGNLFFSSIAAFTAALAALALVVFEDAVVELIELKPVAGAVEVVIVIEGIGVGA